jgi:hypothetical protein
MYQKDAVRQAWAAAGLYGGDAKLRGFFEHVDASPIECWSDLAMLVRTRYPEYLEQLVLPIWNSGDKLLRLNLIRAAALDRPAELELLARLVPQLHGEQDEPELRAVVQRDHPQLLGLVAKIPDLPRDLRTLVNLRRQRRRSRAATPA